MKFVGKLYEQIDGEFVEVVGSGLEMSDRLQAKLGDNIEIYAENGGFGLIAVVHTAIFGNRQLPVGIPDTTQELVDLLVEVRANIIIKFNWNEIPDELRARITAAISKHDKSK